MVQNLNESEMALFGVPRLRALEMYLTPPTLSETRCFASNEQGRSFRIADNTGVEQLDQHCTVRSIHPISLSTPIVFLTVWTTGHRNRPDRKSN